VDYEKKIAELIDREKENDFGYAKQWIENIKGKKNICIFGAGGHASNWIAYLKKNEIEVDFVCDNNPQYWGGKFFHKIPCISPDELNNIKKETCIVIAVRDYMPIRQQLEKMGCTDIYIATVNLFSFATSYTYSGHIEKLNSMKDNLLRLIKICEDDESKKVCLETAEKWFDEAHKKISVVPNQYFMKDIMNLGNRESFVDIGAFDGDTIDEFLMQVDHQYDAIYALEMDRKIYEKLVNKVQALPEDLKKKIFLFQLGAWDTEKTISYNSNMTSSVINPDGDELANVKPLDDILQGKKITFIKMDIEGAELNALYGSQKLIRRYKPKLAICTYHKTEHLWEIPFYIKQLYPEYKIYIRHHDFDEHETVCYAVNE